MDVAVLTAVCSAGLVAGVVMVVAWGGTRTAPAPLIVPDDPPPTALIVRRILRTVCVIVVGGTIAGVLVGGLGSRLMMRILAATSGDEAQGLQTDAEEIVGEITLGGTIGLIIFVGVFGGLLGAAVYIALRRWLPGSPRRAGFLLGLLLLFFARDDPLDPENVDFAILEPTWLAVLLITVLFPFYGMLVASVVERLDRSWPLLEGRPAAIAAHLPLIIIVPAVPLLFGVAVVTLAVLVIVRLEPVGRAIRSPAVDRAGRGVLAVMTIVVVGWVGAGAIDILRA